MLALFMLVGLAILADKSDDIADTFHHSSLCFIGTLQWAIHVACRAKAVNVTP